MRSKTRLIAALTAGLLVIGCTTAVAAATSTPVACTITDNTLSCPLPEPPAPVTETQTVTNTETVTPDPVTQTATVTEAAPAQTVTVTAAPPATTSATPTPSSTTPAPTTPVSTTTTPPPASGWPGPDNTGVPAGVALTAYTGPMTITAANTVIDGKTITGNLVIKASGVIVRNSRVNGTIGTDENSTGYGFTIEDSEVYVGDRAGTGIGAVNFTVRRVEVTGGNRSMNCWKTCLIEDSWVHQQMTDETGVNHESGIRMGAGGTIRHNTIVCDAPDFPPDAGCSADLTGYGDFATVANMTIDRNFFGATTGGYCAYGGSSAGKPYPNAHHIVFTNNTFGTKNPDGSVRRNDHNQPDCGYYGSITAFNTGATGNVWSGNVFDDGRPVNP